MAFLDINIKGKVVPINADSVTIIKVVPLAKDKWGIQLDWLPKNSAIIKLNDDGYFSTQGEAETALEDFVEEAEKAIIDKDPTLYRIAGSLDAVEITSALLVEENTGNVYNINEAFTTTDDFLEGADKDYPAGTNIVVVDRGEGNYKFDVLGGLFNTLTQIDIENEDVESKLVTGKLLKGELDKKVDKVLRNEEDNKEYTFELYIDEDGDLAYEIKESE